MTVQVRPALSLLVLILAVWALAHGGVSAVEPIHPIDQLLAKREERAGAPSADHDGRALSYLVGLRQRKEVPVGGRWTVEERRRWDAIWPVAEQLAADTGRDTQRYYPMLKDLSLLAPDPVGPAAVALRQTLRERAMASLASEQTPDTSRDIWFILRNVLQVPEGSDRFNARLLDREMAKTPSLFPPLIAGISRDIDSDEHGVVPLLTACVRLVPERRAELVPLVMRLRNPMPRLRMLSLLAEGDDVVTAAAVAAIGELEKSALNELRFETHVRWTPALSQAVVPRLLENVSDPNRFDQLFKRLTLTPELCRLMVQRAAVAIPTLATDKPDPAVMWASVATTSPAMRGCLSSAERAPWEEAIRSGGMASVVGYGVLFTEADSKARRAELAAQALAAMTTMLEEPGRRLIAQAVVRLLWLDDLPTAEPALTALRAAVKDPGWSRVTMVQKELEQLLSQGKKPDAPRLPAQGKQAPSELMSEILRAGFNASTHPPRIAEALAGNDVNTLVITGLFARLPARPAQPWMVTLERDLAAWWDRTPITPVESSMAVGAITIWVGAAGLSDRVPAWIDQVAHLAELGARDNLLDTPDLALALSRSNALRTQAWLDDLRRSDPVLFELATWLTGPSAQPLPAMLTRMRRSSIPQTWLQAITQSIPPGAEGDALYAPLREPFLALTETRDAESAAWALLKARFGR